LAASLLVVAVVLRARHRLVIALVSTDLARTAGIDVERLDLVYLLVFGLTVALGLRYLGVLLMGSLIIIPAAAARHLARSLSGMLAWAAALAVLATTLGTVGAAALGVGTGPMIIAVAAGLFFIGLMWRRS
jgi:ABC-type Mn2+/Zn2+ transport system permease subunit